ncbi:MAG: SH3 domain-containing protein [Sedimentisphaerales bacterium]
MRYHAGLLILISVVGIVCVGITIGAPAAEEGPALVIPQVSVSDSPSFPYEAEITGDNVNVRSGPGINYYICSQLNTGAKVRILSNQDGVWSQIQPPPGSFSWISAQYVEIDPTDQTIGTVTGDDVRVYAGSDRVSPLAATRLQGKLNKGEKVKLLGEQSNNYYKIAVPSLPDAYLWISTQYTKPIAPETPVVDPIVNVGGAASVQPAESNVVDSNEAVLVTELPEPTPLEKYRELQRQFDVERVKPLNEQDYSAIKEGLQEIMNDKDADKAARYANVILSRIEGIELALEVDKVVKQQNEQLKQTTDKIDKAHTQRLQEIQNLGRFAAVGKLENFLALGSGNYKILDDSGVTICYAVPSDKASGRDLSALVGEKVGLVGTIEPHTQTSLALVRFDEVESLQ